MESKLPKRPASALKPIVPTDRIKTSALNTQKHVLASYRNLTNLQKVGPVGQVRAASPNTRPIAIQSQLKMRRSRSECDLTSFKRTDTDVPTKFSRYAEKVCPSNARAAVSCVKGLDITKPKTVAKTNSVTRFTKTATNSSLSSKQSALSTSTTGAAKPINKRIPPYDFKARYHDLLEKFKSLKEKSERTNEKLSKIKNASEQLEECQSELIKTKEELRLATEQKENYLGRILPLEMKVESLSSNLTTAKQELDALEETFKIVSAENIELNKKTAILEETSNRQQEELQLCKEQLFRINIERKELHNALMDLRGNIRVFCRVRPPLVSEEDKPVCEWKYFDETSFEILNHDLISKNKPGSHAFDFDHVFHPGCRQEDVFELVSPLIQSAMDGYNICIFAYGQTGSGKTYTMDGIESNPGVIPRTVNLIFQSIDNYQRLGWQFTIKATFLEIYNEVLYDLLSNEQKDMEIRMVKNSKNEIYVSNITEETVLSANHLRELMTIAKMNRATAATVANERSSRSHSVTKIQLIGYNAERNETSIGTVNLVDLAGSESPKTSIRMNETKNINRSLSELTNVILALVQKQDHIPYRNSKLTHLLMPALGGNSKTVMFINVAPFLDCYVESVKSLRFAAAVNSCKLAKAKRNRFLNTNNCNGPSDK